MNYYLIYINLKFALSWFINELEHLWGRIYVGEFGGRGFVPSSTRMDPKILIMKKRRLSNLFFQIARFTLILEKYLLTSWWSFLLIFQAPLPKVFCRNFQIFKFLWITVISHRFLLIGSVEKKNTFDSLFVNYLTLIFQNLYLITYLRSQKFH